MTNQVAPDVGGPQQPEYAPPPPLNKRDAKAQAAAAKAYWKSQRGWIARHKLMTGLAALAVIIVAIVALVNSGSKSTISSPGAATSDAPTVGAHIATPVRDGKFEFTVVKIDPRKSGVGTAPLSKNAQGQFVLVHLMVKNIGTEAQTFDQGSQVMLDQSGNKLSPDTEASLYVDPSNFLAKINPGNSIKGTLVFDIAKGAVPTQLELHDSAFSSGVMISLK